jgi:hypothetical protein
VTRPTFETIHYQYDARFARYVRQLGPSYAAEVSYRNRIPARYGLLGTVRADAIFGNPLAPAFAVDLKTGGAYITVGQQRRSNEHLPLNTVVYELRVFP